MTGFDAEPPGVQRRDVVLVAGPPSAGASAVVTRLRERLPAHRFVCAVVAGEAPLLVVFVVSAVAPITPSDCALAEQLSRCTAARIGVVAKIDDHRAWRAVLDADRAALGTFTWVGAAAAPRLGPAQVDDLVDTVAAALADPALASANRWQAWQGELSAALAREQQRIADARERTEALRRHREELVDAQRRSRAAHALARRERVARVRLDLTAATRRRCAALHTELTVHAAQGDRRALDELARRVPVACAAAFAELRAGAGPDARDVELDIPARPVPPRRLETQLMTVLGAGFGLGVAWALTRLLTGVAPQATVAAVLTGLLAGAAVTVWVVRARALLQDRAEMQRWIGQATQSLRAAAEIEVAEQVLALEAALATEPATEEAGLADLESELRHQRRECARIEGDSARIRASLQRRLDMLAELQTGYPSVAIPAGGDLNRS